MTMPRLTVAISFSNEAEHLGAAIRSILSQTYRDFELLLIDDGSTDASVEIAREHEARDPRVRVFADGRHRFLGARLNEALRHARGELFARMDGDDLSHPDRLRRAIEHLDRAPDCMAIGCAAIVIDARERPIGVVGGSADPLSAPEVRPVTRTHRSILERGVIAHATMVARTDWLARFPYDESLERAEDRDLWCRIDPMTRIDAIDDPLYVIRVLVERPGFLTDYLRGQAELRRVVLRYGPVFVDPLTLARILGSSTMKSAAMTVAHVARLSRRLVERRGRAPSAREIELLREAIAASRPQAP